jgi:hypothetical protein
MLDRGHPRALEQRDTFPTVGKPECAGIVQSSQLMF